MTDEIHILYGNHRDTRRPREIIRVFDTEQPARSWAALLNGATNDHKFPLTYAELKQEFGWIPNCDHAGYEVSSHPVHADGWGREP